MPYKPARLCGCGRKVAYGAMCVCQRQRRAEIDRQRPTARQRGYDTQWDKARSTFLASNSSCSFCGATATVVDHIVPHRGDMKLFWKKANWQPLCKPCHDGRKQAQEKRNHHA